MDAEISTSWWEPRSVQRFPLSKPVVGQTIALHAAPADRTCIYPAVPAFPIHSTSFSPNLTEECVINSESECDLR